MTKSEGVMSPPWITPSINTHNEPNFCDSVRSQDNTSTNSFKKWIDEKAVKTIELSESNSTKYKLTLFHIINIDKKYRSPLYQFNIVRLFLFI